MLDCDLAKLYQVETGVFATRWVGVDWSFKEMPQNQHLMGNAVFVNPPKTHTDPLRTCTDLQNCRQRFQGIWGVFSSKIAHLHRSWNAVFARYLRLFAGASCVSRGQKCATKTVVKTVVKWKTETLWCSNCKGFSDLLCWCARLNPEIAVMQWFQVLQRNAKNDQMTERCI